MRAYLEESLAPEPIEGANPIDRLKNVLRLASKVESALFPLDGEEGANVNFQIRLARAQVLGAIDVLTEVLRKVEGPRSTLSGGVYPASATAQPASTGSATRAPSGSAH